MEICQKCPEFKTALLLGSHLQMQPHYICNRMEFVPSEIDLFKFIGIPEKSCVMYAEYCMKEWNEEEAGCIKEET